MARNVVNRGALRGAQAWRQRQRQQWGSGRQGEETHAFSQPWLLLGGETENIWMGRYMEKEMKVVWHYIEKEAGSSFFPFSAIVIFISTCHTHTSLSYKAYTVSSPAFLHTEGDEKASHCLSSSLPPPSPPPPPSSSLPLLLSLIPPPPPSPFPSPQHCHIRFKLFAFFLFSSSPSFLFFRCCITDNIFSLLFKTCFHSFLHVR